MDRIPKKYFITKGHGTGQTKLLSFEAALQDAKIAHFNLVKVSSIIPPDCQQISRSEGLKQLSKGEIVHTVLSENYTAQIGQKISCALGIARPQDATLQGYVYEHSEEDHSQETTGTFAEKCAITMVGKAAGVDIQGVEDIKANKAILNLLSESKFISIEAKLTAEDKFLTVLAALLFVL